jgi:uroporphyrinogen decarboxylase
VKYNPRERCYRAVKREEIDLIPINIWIDSPEPLGSLLKQINLDDLEKLLRYLKIDYRGIPGFFPTIGLKGGFEVGTFVDNHGRTLHRDVFGIVTAESGDGLTSMHVDHPLKHMEVEKYTFPEVEEEDLEKVKQFRKRYEDFCVVGYSLQAFETACALFGYNELFKRMIIEPKTVDFVLDRLFEITYKQAELLAEAGVDQVYNGDDVGTQTGMMISPTQWRKFLKPRYEKLAGIIHKGDAFFHFHSDGWIVPIIPDLIEIGVDVLEPVQPECMDLKKIKEEFGDKLSFEGGIGVQRLPFKTVEEVEAEVKNAIAVLGPTGYTLRPSHTIVRGTPIENILALYEAANKHRVIKRLDLRS